MTKRGGWSASRMGALLLTLLSVGASAAAPIPLSEAELDQLRQSVAAARERKQQADDAACLRELARTRELALRDWSLASQRWWMADIHCRTPQQWPSERAQTEALLHELHAGLRAHYLAPPAGVPVDMQGTIAARFAIAYGMLAVDVARADEMELAEVERLRALPEAEALPLLRGWARNLYGRGPGLDQWERRLRDWYGEGHELTLRALRGRAFFARRMARHEEALALSEEAMARWQRHQSGNRQLRVMLVSERAGAYANLGRYAEARDDLLYWRDYQLTETPPLHGNLMRAHYNLASLAINMGDFDAAVAYADAAIDHGMRSSDALDFNEARLPRVLRERARLLRGDADAPAALAALLRRFDTVVTPQEAGWPTLARHAQRQGDAELLDESLHALRRYAGQFQEPTHPERALLGLHEARLARLQGEPGEFGPAWAHSLMAGSPTVAVEAQLTVAAEQREPAAAIWVYKRAASALQALRQGLPEDLPGGARAWLADHEPDLRRFIGLLIDEGRLAEAQEAVRLLREEELHEYTRRSRGRRQGQTAQPLSRTPLEQRLDAQAAAVASALQPVRSAARQRTDARPWSQQRYAAADEPLQQALRQGGEQLQALLAQAAAAHEAAAPRPEALPREPAGRLRLRFFLRADRLDLIASDARGSRHHRLSVARASLHQSLHALRSALQQPGSEPLPLAQALYRQLLAPEAAALAAARELVIEPDGALRYLPFAVLHDGQRYLAERLPLRLDFGHAGAAPASASPATPRLLALGSTQGNDELSPLPGVQRELDQLRALPLRATVAQDQGFGLQTLQQGLRERANVVHLASHLVLNPASEAESYLLLGNGERASLGALRQLDWQGVHLVLLSACDSGVPSGHGREMAGFASALQQAGARHVLATLWPVSDGVTAQWMAGFYAPWRQGARNALPDPRWLRNAQRQWLRQHAGTPLAHPHYWAGFAWLGA